jgi:hypothetical protein
MFDVSVTEEKFEGKVLTSARTLPTHTNKQGAKLREGSEHH